MLHVLGIDFGTTKSLLSYIRSSKEPENVEPKYTTFTEDSMLCPTQNDAPFNHYNSSIAPPTVIAIDEKSELDARPRIIAGFKAINPHNKRFNDLAIISNLKERMASHKEKDRVIDVKKYKFPVEGLVANFLASLYVYAVELRNIEITHKGITITVPAKAGILQRMTMMFAARVAGFEEIDLIEEPVAAFLYHKHFNSRSFNAERLTYTLVIDFGGGTCDLAIVESQQGKLPRVIGRSMARFGGGHIDDAFLRKFWLPKEKINTSTKNSLFSLDEYEEADKEIQLLLLAYARHAKEVLSDKQESTYTTTLQGEFLTHPGEFRPPSVPQEDFQKMLENDKFDAFYPDGNETSRLSVRGHLESLIKKVLIDARMDRSSIDKLIFAGGSSKLPHIVDWTVGLLTSSSGDGRAHKGFNKETDIFQKDPEVCVAGGAAIHQLYRHHPSKKWRKSIRPTLSTNIEIVYYNDAYGNKKKAVFLGKQNDDLPIKCNNYFVAKVISNPKPWPDDGKLKVRLRAQEWEQTIELPDNFKPRGLFKKVWPAILIYYHIDEFGILQHVRFVPGSIFQGWRWNHDLRQPIPNTNEQLGPLFNKLRLTNESHIRELRKRFIPQTLHF